MGFFDPHYSVLPDRAYLRELRRPWKLATFAMGMGWLLYGATHYGIGDWDVGISIVMGGLTYLLAPWSVLLIGSGLRYRRRWWWAHMILAISVAIFVADTSYVIYHTLAGNPMYRDANFRASIAFYFIAGTLWLYRGSLKDMAREFRQAITR
ncbi:hypothetical protein [Lysobacter capsici]|uniref:hypothetical protein n=1 Tax=Lysobacter capsici TaxID=435897 RepID=UPI0012FD0775|nr:hypothetical protein [Lysobacter capsici]